MIKNSAGQYLPVYAWDSANDIPAINSAANITAYRSLDGGSAIQLSDTNPAEIDASNMPGLYLFSLSQAETNGDLFAAVAKSSTADIKIEPVVIYTTSG